MVPAGCPPTGALGYTGIVAVRTRQSLVFLEAAGQAPPAARFGFPFRLLLVLGLLPLLLLASLLLVYRQQESGRIYGGVTVLDVDLGRLTRDDAAAAIRRSLADHARQGFLLRFDDDAISVTLATMGLVIDDAQIGALADQATQVGHDQDFVPW